MTNYGIQYSITRPQETTITDKDVYVASNIEPYSKEIEDHIVEGYQFNLVSYTKDEYLLQQSTNITALQEELRAAKVLLGVD